MSDARNAELLPTDIAQQQLEPFSAKGEALPVHALRVWPPSRASLSPPVEILGASGGG